MLDWLLNRDLIVERNRARADLNWARNRILDLEHSVREMGDCAVEGIKQSIVAQKSLATIRRMAREALGIGLPE